VSNRQIPIARGLPDAVGWNEEALARLVLFESEASGSEMAQPPGQQH
jgi:hypothetical protein